MAEAEPDPQVDAGAPRRDPRNWDAVAAVVAALIGFLALFVSAYTASIQRQQVRAQVWPYLEVGNEDFDQSVVVYSKGVGPAIVHSAQVFIDGKPQSNWNAVLTAVGLQPRGFQQSTLNPSVLLPGEHLKVIKFGVNEVASVDEKEKEKEEERQKARWEQFRREAEKRMTMNICFCSTLDECWMYSDSHPIGYKEYTQLVKPVDQCPRIATTEMFVN